MIADSEPIIQKRHDTKIHKEIVFVVYTNNLFVCNINENSTRGNVH